MTGRIRTVKPDFFKHEGLYELGKSSGLGPIIRLIYEGLWCQADRQGRFRWRPRLLRNEICPWDDLDFENAIEKLRAGGYLVKYEVGGETYGVIPTFLRHQRPNHREAESEIPPPPGTAACPGTPGHAPASPGGTGTELEGKGKELELEGEGSPPARSRSSIFQTTRRSSREWDQSVELMQRMGFDEDTIDRVERSKVDVLHLYPLLRDTFDKRGIANKAAYVVAALQKMEAGEWKP